MVGGKHYPNSKNRFLDNLSINIDFKNTDNTEQHLCAMSFGILHIAKTGPSNPKYSSPQNLIIFPPLK